MAALQLQECNQKAEGPGGSWANSGSPAEAKGTAPSDFIGHQGLTSEEEEAGCLAEEGQQCPVVLEEPLTLPPWDRGWSCCCLGQCEVLAGARRWQPLLAAWLQPVGREGGTRGARENAASVLSQSNERALAVRQKPQNPEPPLRLSLEKTTKKGQTNLHGCNFT